MKLPLSWLNEYVKVDDIAPEELAEKLTRAGLQVEAIETVGGNALSESIVVAEVIECEKHPSSDHLHVCRVTDGVETYQVVCGAPNMRLGIKTAFAKIGSGIPAFIGKDGKIEKIKKTKLRGVESFGMCCSEKELCIGEGTDGIIEYPQSVANGTPVRDVACLEKPEVVFEIEVTWNRPDALGVIGLAREFGAILGRPVCLPELTFDECEKAVEDEVKVVVENTEKCPRYVARVVTDMDCDLPSPDFIAKRLELCGVRPLGLAVDVTNYVMLEFGQPMHAFDHTRLEDRTVVVRDARDGEEIRTLDGAVRKLDSSMLVICDKSRPSAVAGIMGGEDSGIAPGTRSVMLESALFDPASTKYASSALGLSSEASVRFIRGVDKDAADRASRRAAHLLQKYGGAKIAKGSIDVDNRLRPGPAEVEGALEGVDYSFNAPVSLNFDRARKLIGIDVSTQEIFASLESLQLRRIQADETSATFAVPSWRWDISLEADLVEEIARLHELENIPDTMPSAPSISSLSDAPFRAVSRVRDICEALGFNEAMHYSFLSEKELDDFDSSAERKALRLQIPDPVSAEYAIMRDSLMPQMYATLGRNSAHEEKAMLYEIGKVFSVSEGNPVEKRSLCIGFAGPVGRESLRRRVALKEEEAALWMKGAVEELVTRLHAGKLEFVPAKHPAFAAALEIKVNARAVGVLGVVSASLRHPFRMSTQMALAEISLDAIIKRTNAVGKVSAVAPFPSVKRDIAVTLASGVTNADIVEVIRKNGGKELVRIDLFDVFKNSRAYSLEFLSSERTLTDEQVGLSFRRVLDALKAMEGVEVREG